jgi:hypothetical protein
MNTATREVCEVALGLYENTDINPDDVGDVEDYLRREAEEMVSTLCAAEDDEMWPSWCTLVVTPAINKTIDWKSIQETVVNMLVDRECDDLFDD